MPFVRFSRDRRGYEHTYLVHESGGRGRPVRARILYWFRTPPGIKVGREPFDDEARRKIESQNPGISFDWKAIAGTPMPPVPEVEHWRERRRAERAAKVARREEEREEERGEGREGERGEAPEDGRDDERQEEQDERPDDQVEPRPDSGNIGPAIKPLAGRRVASINEAAALAELAATASLLSQTLVEPLALAANSSEPAGVTPAVEQTPDADNQARKRRRRRNGRRRRGPAVESTGDRLDGEQPDAADTDVADVVVDLVVELDAYPGQPDGSSSEGTEASTRQPPEISAEKSHE